MSWNAKFALYTTIAANVIVFMHWEPSSFISDVFSVVNSTLKAMMVSMFSHADLQHLASNMLYLFIYGNKVFVQSTSATWQSPLAFLLVYYGSGFGAFYGNIAVASVHEQIWSKKIRDRRNAVRCTHWMCEKVRFDWISRPFVDTVTYLINADEAAGLAFYKYVPRIGASGAVFGIAGAMVYTSVRSGSPWHSPMGRLESMLLLAQIAQEFQLAFESSKTLRLSNFFSSNHYVDHVGHIAGFVSGVVIAAVLQQVALRGWNHNDAWGQGRRVGG
jgi:membrane associated rhomboid family serine protease